MTHHWFRAAALASSLALGGGLACHAPSPPEGAGGAGRAGVPKNVSRGALQNGYAGIGQRGEDTALAAGNSSGGPVGGNTTIRGPATEGDYPDISGASGSIGMAGIDVPPDLSWSGYGNTGQKGAAFAPAPQGQEPTGR